VLEVSDLRVGYGKHEVLRDISLTVAPGEVLAVLGTNGAGKSTLLNCIAGLVPASSGSVFARSASSRSAAVTSSMRSGVARTTTWCVDFNSGNAWLSRS